MDAALALIAAFLFAVAATLQQKGALHLPKVSLTDPASLLELIKEKVWLLGTVALLCGYVVQAIALDEGRLSIVQPLLVTTVVFALPLGYWLTGQHVGPKEIVGAAVIMCGLALFTVLADPAGGNENAPNVEWAIVITLIAIASATLLHYGGRDGADPGTRAAVYGTVAGMLFGLSAALTKPTLTFLSEGIGTMLSNWQPYVLAVAGILGFVLQQISLGTGRLAPAVATVSTVNPIVGIVIGTVLLDETWSRPTWHVVVAGLGLLVALAGAVVISLSSQAGSSHHAEPATSEAAVTT